MTNSKFDLILHPVRIRIITALGEGQKTPQQLARTLPDIAQATLYRHINTLAEGGILTVVAENQVRGTTESVYALADPSQLRLSAEEANALTKDDHMRYFTMFTMTLIKQFTQYLHSTELPDFAADGVGYHTTTLYMTDEDMQTFGIALNKLVMPYLTKHGDDALPRLFTTVVMPASDLQSDAGEQDD